MNQEIENVSSLNICNFSSNKDEKNSCMVAKKQTFVRRCQMNWSNYDEKSSNFRECYERNAMNSDLSFDNAGKKDAIWLKKENLFVPKTLKVTTKAKLKMFKLKQKKTVYSKTWITN